MVRCVDMHTPRIQLHMTGREILQEMAREPRTPYAREGGYNPGGLRVAMEIFQEGGKIDPDASDGLVHLLHLDTLGVYGSRLWMLYKDVCGQDLRKTIATIRAYQLGFVEPETLNAMIDDGVEISDKILAQVKERLPDFQLEAA